MADIAHGSINIFADCRLATCFNICSAESANLVLDATDNHIFKNWFSARGVEFHFIWKFS